MPVGSLGKFLFNHIADQQNLTAAQQSADHKGGKCRYKYHGDAADDARYGQGQNNAEKSMYTTGAKVS